MENSEISVLAQVVGTLCHINRALLDRAGEKQRIPCIQIQVALRGLSLVNDSLNNVP
jgi:hypothetical protein